MAGSLKAAVRLLCLVAGVASAASCGSSNNEDIFTGVNLGSGGSGSGAVASGGNAGTLADAAHDTSAAGGTGGTGATTFDGAVDVANDSPVSQAGAAGAIGCNTVWCRDQDHDTHGDPQQTKTACESPGADWVTLCDDCHDDNADVHPGAPCQTMSYQPAQGGGDSFDYNCDGVETECGQIAKATTCGPTVLQCGGSGYLPNPDRQATTTQNAYCGSTQWRQCTALATFCGPQTQTREAVGCN
jgi:hypothetical protein